MAPSTDNLVALGPQADRSSLSPAREALASAIRALADASAELDRVQAPAQRLGAIGARLDKAERDLAALRSEDDRRLGEWLAAGVGDGRPEANPETTAAADSIVALRLDADAARTMLPEVEAAHRRAAERVRAAHQRRDEALAGAAVEAARELAGSWLGMLSDVMKPEAALHGLAAELTAMGNRGAGCPAALGAAAAIKELITATRRSAGAPHDLETGRRLLAALASDPEAALELR